MNLWKRVSFRIRQVFGLLPNAKAPTEEKPPDTKDSWHWRVGEDQEETFDEMVLRILEDKKQQSESPPPKEDNETPS